MLSETSLKETQRMPISDRTLAVYVNIYLLLVLKAYFILNYVLLL